MPEGERARLVALTTLLSRLHPDLNYPAQLISRGLVLVDGRAVLNPSARVHSDAAIRILGPRRLRGELELRAALTQFGIDVNDRIALDVGAAAGGFTAAIVAAGAARVYVVDTGHGQLMGWLRADPRVVNLERTNLGQVDRNLVPDTIEVVTMDLYFCPSHLPFPSSTDSNSPRAPTSSPWSSRPSSCERARSRPSPNT